MSPPREGGGFSPAHAGYERPGDRWTCGRGAAWERPCDSGPRPDGGCGGVFECAPFHKGDRWLCRRPIANGGPCETGPRADGRCSREHPPCAPRASMRHVRGRLAWLAVGAVLATIFGFSELGRSRVGPLDPGPISHHHLGFVRKRLDDPGDRGCGGCHAAHGTGAAGWTQALAKPADLTSSCLSCHRFSGHREDSPAGRERAERAGRSPHDDLARAARPGARATECTMCHTEHNGALANLVRLDEAQCSTCHKVKIESFAQDHPAFPPKFPYATARSFRYDHLTHFNRYFKTRKAEAPTSCTGCHDAASAQRQVKPTTFERMCAACHTGSISTPDDPDRDLLLLGLPKTDYAALPPELRPKPDGKGAMSCPSEMAGPPAAMAFLLECAPEDAKGWNRPAFELLVELAGYGASDEMSPVEKRVRALVARQSGRVVAAVRARMGALTGDAKRATFTAALASLFGEEARREAAALLSQLDREQPARPDARLDELFAARFGADGPRVTELAGRLVRGLNRETLATAAASWIREHKECATAGGVPPGTWYATAFELRYKASGHADPVVRAWIEWALASERASAVWVTEAPSEKAEARAELERARAFRARMTDPRDGPGQCMKCHVVTEELAMPGAHEVEWAFRRGPGSPHFAFAHAPHLQFMLADTARPAVKTPVEVSGWSIEGCVTCHRLGEANTGPAAGVSSSFRPIRRETCLECHSKNLVRQDCLLCHRYHKEPSFTDEFRKTFRHRLEQRATTGTSRRSGP